MEKKIRNLWKHVIPQQQFESTETKATYKSLSLAENVTILDDEEAATIIERAEQKDDSDAATVLNGTIIENNTTQVPVNLHKSHHVILDEIARGGMGAVYHGNQMCLNRDVAIKKMLATNEETSSRFISEALVTAFLDHPNIVPIYELSKNESEEIILAMKLVGGNTWSDLLESKDFDDHLQILLSVCNAVAYAHSKGIIHCDLKPANIMIGEFGEVLVMDWGIAVDISPGEVKRGIPQKDVHRPMGTPCYMPAELAEGRGEDIGPWTDVYLLGGILYKLLTKKPPHQGQTILEVLRSACTGCELDFATDTPLEIQEICRKALALSPQERYQTTAEFNNDLRSFIKHRESILIANQAHTKFTLCVSNSEAKNIYEEVTTCISGFQQALELWADNLQAKTWRHDARIFYAQTALRN
ncbi:serine/threonine protein kinase [Candidatus Uabimicrobium amorphum]|uniref:Protein kinase n=1 Tax=Uabimicrobium amorphum TaxID=2596890 RepID=A0A5S9IPN5_UABAM|nr:serine/threonine-protein kinase [Candidatus Uabimicrobium amorphum]BBM85759.1 protein kinase [Candidatus Uabimicrobium amorphum]